MKKNNSKEAPQLQFWSCLKKCDVEGLERILLHRVVDPATAAVTFEIDREAARQLVNTPNAKKMLPLSYAVSQGMDERGLHLLLRAGSDVNATDGASERSTALHTACWGEDDVAVSLLLRCGANPLVTDSEFRTPLHVLASLNAAELFSYFLEATTNGSGSAVEQQDGLLCLNGHSPVVVSAADLLGKRDLREFTVLHTALSDVCSGSDGVVTELLNYLDTIARTDPATVMQLVNMATDSGGNSLHLILACSNCSDSAMVRIVQRLLKLGANPTACDNWNQTPLCVAVRTHSGPVVGILLSLLLQTVQDKGEEQLESVFVQYDLAKGYMLINHAISVQNTEAVKAMVAFLKPLDEASGSKFVRQWLGEFLTADNQSVVQMLADGACDEIAHILINCHAIDRDEYELRKNEADKRRRGEREEGDKENGKERNGREECVKEGGVNMRGEGDAANSCRASENTTGDFSGFGSITTARAAATATAGRGSRVQQVRKARAQAAAQRKEYMRNGLDGGNGRTHALNRAAAPLWIKVAAVLLFLMMMFRGYNLLQGLTRD